MKCLNQGCENEVTSVVGRRPRQFCSNNCRQKDWQRKQRESQLVNAARGRDASGVNEDENKPKSAPKPQKKGIVPPKDEMPVNSPQNGSDLKAGVMCFDNEGRKTAVITEPQPPEGLTEIQLAVWKNDQKRKNNPKPSPITQFGVTKKEKDGN